MKVYIASPFFSPQQLGVVEKIEQELEDRSIDYFSPRKEGILRSMTPGERAHALKRVYDKNIVELEVADILLAVTDNFDPGTIFEIGYFTGVNNVGSLDRPLITLSASGHGSNVMLAQSAKAHIQGAEGVGEKIEQLIAIGTLESDPIGGRID